MQGHYNITQNILFGVATAILRISRRVVYHWKGIFQRYITRPEILKIAVATPKRNFCSRLVTAANGGQTNRSQFWLQFFTKFSYSL